MIKRGIELLKKYREPILYLIFGGLTTMISWGLSSLLYYVIFDESHNILSNVISEFTAITFAYVTNKIFVFCSKTTSKKAFFTEFFTFYAVRLASAVVNVGGMKLLVDVWNFEFWICKIALNVIIIILNYLFSKFMIFNKDNAENKDKSKENSADEKLKKVDDCEEKIGLCDDKIHNADGEHDNISIEAIEENEENKEEIM